MKNTTEDLFFDKIEFEPMSGCWLWGASVTDTGYAVFHADGFHRGHRWAYNNFNGDIGELFVLHKCHQRSCVNPRHLKLGTNRDNMFDMSRLGVTSGKKSSCNKLDEDEVLMIVEMAKTTTHKKTADAYKVSKATVTSICSGGTWNWLTKIKSCHPINHKRDFK